ncbi:TonB-dependent receptor [Alteromonas sp. C1M14]|uniref:TonB-dependent receptor n=1 Tax=Alteromonas sp. C1M14 TaxID=2841567 RepID=UPI001C081CA4|nr:TonB-dependent receptor [Alteromonas sp. C1M14]MBU2978571.1 TonB-dependent receptor [Alteromonas sp. C1M14]
MKKFNVAASWMALLPFSFQVFASTDEMPADDDIENVVIWSSGSLSQEQGVSPSSHLTPSDLEAANLVTTEDLVKYQPSLTIRRRYIGDANGTLGIRSANMFQTSRSMVFADGVPLHYLLQSRWSGAPRWTMVSASEIADVEVIYGPFDAQYSGNAMGGVVRIETAIPQEAELHVDATVFQQQFDAYGYDDSLTGNKSFISAGNKYGNTSVYVSYNHLNNVSQPQSYYYGAVSEVTADSQEVSGALEGDNQYGESQLFFGDTGPVEETTDNVKLKLGHEWNQWFALLNVAYEDRNSDKKSPNSYVKNADGQLVYSGDVVQDGTAFTIAGSRFSVSELERKSLSVGLRVRGDINDRTALEANVNHFAILKDQQGTSQYNPNSSLYDGSGQIADYDDSGWFTGGIKLTMMPDVGADISVISGVDFASYELNYNLYDSDHYAYKDNAELTSTSGGKTETKALYSQLDWYATPQWTVNAGLRYEMFDSFGGYYSTIESGVVEETDVPTTTQRKFSPKLSVSYLPDENWQIRYSWAKAYRFPIVEELFSQYKAYNSVSVSNASLLPEDGLHHNLMVQRNLSDGLLRVNLFVDNIRNVIESQSTTLAGGQSLSTFIPIDKVLTKGAEFIANQDNWLLDGMNVKLNVTYTHSEIEENAANELLVGNDYPRIPHWRGNLLLDYNATENLTLGVSVQYASNSYGTLTNTDHASNVYGAIDSYTWLGVSSRYKWNEHLQFRFGIDNLANDIAYVAHPYPGRTAYLSFEYDM